MWFPHWRKKSIAHFGKWIHDTEDRFRLAVGYDIRFKTTNSNDVRPN